MKNETVYIGSINKRIPFEEFENNCIKVGHAYKLSDAYLIKCVDKEESGWAIVESITALPKTEYDGCQVIISNKHRFLKASLDFVNCIFDGTYKEISVEEYDRVYNFIKSSSLMAYNYINKMIE